MRVAITGATGFIGRHIVRALHDRGDHLILLGRDIEKLQSTFSAQTGVFRLVQSDYVQGLDTALKGVEAVVHLAGLRYWKDRVMMDYIRSNVVNTDRLFSSAVAHGIDNIVFASTIAVYNPRFNSAPFSEDQCCSPQTHYGVSKLVCEKIAFYDNSRFGTKIKSLRIGQVVGQGEREGFMLSAMIRQARSKQPIEVWGEGVGTRDYVYIKDVVQAILDALDHPYTAGLFNISRGEAVTHLQLAETINQAFGNVGNVTFAADKLEDTSCVFASCERAECELGWRANWDLAEMFADLANVLERQEDSGLPACQI